MEDKAAAHPTGRPDQPKDIENRSWATSHRGELATHAGQAVDWAAPDHAWHAAGLVPRGGSRFDRAAWTHSLPHGGVLGVLDLAGCHDMRPSVCECSTWAHPLECHWEPGVKRHLAHPLPCRELQRLWRLPADIEAARAQLEAASA